MDSASRLQKGSSQKISSSFDTTAQKRKRPTRSNSRNEKSNLKSQEHFTSTTSRGCHKEKEKVIPFPTNAGNVVLEVAKPSTKQTSSRRKKDLKEDDDCLRKLVKKKATKKELSPNEAETFSTTTYLQDLIASKIKEYKIPKKKVSGTCNSSDVGGVKNLGTSSTTKSPTVNKPMHYLVPQTNIEESLSQDVITEREEGRIKKRKLDTDTIDEKLCPSSKNGSGWEEHQSFSAVNKKRQVKCLSKQTGTPNADAIPLLNTNSRIAKARQPLSKKQNLGVKKYGVAKSESRPIIFPLPNTDQNQVNYSIPGREYQVLTIPSLTVTEDFGDQHNSSIRESSIAHDSRSNYASIEQMEFENPVPEILQMVTESNAADSQSEVDGTDNAMDTDQLLPSTSTTKKHIIVILDTNVWIKDIPLIQKIVSHSHELGAAISIVIPWMVLQEIDHNIHKNNVELSKRREFQNAAKYIHFLLSMKDSKVRGQKAKDALIGMEFSELVADDSILNCVIQHDKLSQFTTVFLTNDINLLNKALVHDLTAFKAETGVVERLKQLAFPVANPEEMPNYSQHASNSHRPTTEQQRSTPPPRPVFNTTNQISFCQIDQIGMDIDDPMGEDNCSTISSNKDNITATGNVQPLHPPKEIPTPLITFDFLMDELRKSLTHIIVPKMVEEYGQDGWKYAIKVKPPFSVESGLKCLQLHWIAVFSYMFPSRCKNVLDVLHETISKKVKGRSEDELRSWRLEICQMALLLLSMNETLVRKPRVSETIVHLKDYIENSQG